MTTIYVTVLELWNYTCEAFWSVVTSNYLDQILD
jgi:hypothetical protein